MQVGSRKIERPAGHLDPAWPGWSRTSIQEVAADRVLHRVTEHGPSGRADVGGEGRGGEGRVQGAASVRERSQHFRLVTSRVVEPLSAADSGKPITC
jgi:hypothetical protein